MRALTVEFAGLDEASGPLTWAQSYMLKMIYMASPGTRGQFNVASYIRIPKGVTFQHVVRAFRALAERHQSFRTVYRVVGGAFEQRVLGNGTIEIDVIHRSEPFAPDSSEIDELFRGLQSEEFDLGKAWPYRATLICRSGAPVFLVIVFSHLTSDAAASALLQREFTSLLLKCRSEAELDSGSPVAQQLEVAAYQQSAEGASRGERSIRHWERVLSRYYRSGQERPRHAGSVRRAQTISMTSRRLASSAATTARRYNTTPSMVFISAAAFAYATISERPGLILEIACSNRTRTWAETQGTLFQFGIAEFSAMGVDFGEVLKNSAATALSAYAHSQYDDAVLDDLRRRLSGGAGPYSQLPAISFVVNDLVGWRLSAAELNIPLDRPDLVRPTFGEFGDGDMETGGYAFYLGYHRAAGGGLRLGLEFDTSMLSRREAAGCLAAIDCLILEAGRTNLSLSEAKNVVRECVTERPEYAI
ncbi:condensation domain-containing protein [Streptosporangium roseum]|uniref:condensation domain-containing protein n=1 Tax=Streptosporangium roseum TaxID=2001 RepID=UPI0033209E37